MNRNLYKNMCPWVFVALKRDHNTCTKCGSTDRVVVHHIDGSRKNGWAKMNNDLENLTTLCRLCHAEVHGIKIRWVGITKEMIIELRNQKFKYREIGEYLGISRQRVHQLIKKWNNP